ncbi:MAG TPA: hypothetical protein VND65_19830 [Candidatus Binatia bacterium]|nr:hypothetical protein [Candidatus Binatia bacterium]
MATTFTGEVTVVFASGLETESGKSFAPPIGGTVVVPSGAGSALVDGDQLIATGGTKG